MPSLAQFVADALSKPREKAFAERLGSAEWTVTSATQMHERARAIAAALGRAGIGAGDRVGVLSENCVDWLAADFGIQYAGCVTVPIFATIALDQIDYIF